MLFGKRRAYQRKVSVPEFDGVCSGDILVFEVYSAEILQEFLPYVVQSHGFFDHALGTSAGSLSPRTKWSELMKYEFALPPFEVQQYVVAILSSVDGVLAGYTTVIDACSRLRRALVREAVSTSRESLPLEEFGTVVRGARFPEELATREARDLAFLKVADLPGSGGFERIKVSSHYISEADAMSLGLFPLPPGSILFQRVGAALRSDRKRVLAIPAIVDENLLACVPSGDVNADALFAVLEQVSLLPWIQDGTVPSINERALRQVPVPLLRSDVADHLATCLLALEMLCDSASAARESLKAARLSMFEAISSGGQG